MCRIFVETQYMKCNHNETWEIPSQDKDCHGILHRLTVNNLQVCKHCWVARGFNKRSWRNKSIRADVDIPEPNELRYRAMALELHVQKVVYPIQSVEVRRTSSCLHWRRHYSWQTRKWALRSLYLERQDNLELYCYTRQENAAPIPLPFYMIDEDSPASPLLELVEPENAFPPNGRCAICLGDFINEDPDERHQAGDGGLRSLICTSSHTFCLDCIRRHILEINAEREMIFSRNWDRHIPAFTCPTCREEFTITIVPRVRMSARLWSMADHYRKRMLRKYQHVPAGHRNPFPEEIGSVEETAFCLGVTALTLPWFFAIEHSMRPSSKLGRIPVSQIPLVIVITIILQVIWMLAVLVGIPTAVTYILVCASIRGAISGPLFWITPLIDWLRHRFQDLRHVHELIREGIENEFRTQATFWGGIEGNRGE